MPERDGRVVRLGLTREIRQEPCRAAQEQHQETSSERIERTRMPHATLAGEPPNDRHDIVRRQPRGLVDQEHAVSQSRSHRL